MPDFNKIEGSAGFSLIEVIIASGIAMIVLLAIASFQITAHRENAAMTQKLEMIEAERQLSAVFADDNLCSCNINGKALVPDPAAVPGGPAMYMADLTELRDKCAGASASGGLAGNPLAEIGKRLPQAQLSSLYQVPVLRIAVQGVTAMSQPDEYLGNITIYLDAEAKVDPTAKERIMVRQLRPISVQKKFFTNPGTLTLAACGPAPRELIISQGNVVSNATTGTTVSVATCPAGTKAIAGGWVDTKKPPNADPFCTANPKFASVITSTMSADQQSWQVLLLCHEYRAVATCYRPSQQQTAAGP